MGTELVASIVGVGLLGYGIDYLCKSLPVGTLVGVGIGILGGGYNFIRRALELGRRAARDVPRLGGKQGKADPGLLPPLPSSGKGSRVQSAMFASEEVEPPDDENPGITP